MGWNLSLSVSGYVRDVGSEGLLTKHVPRNFLVRAFFSKGLLPGDKLYVYFSGFLLFLREVW